MRVLVVPLVFLIPALAMAESAVVYKSVDEQGVVSFSDVPPENSGAVEQLEINATQANSTGEYLENFEAMRETTDRMAEDRRAREKHRAEMRELAEAKSDTDRFEEAGDFLFAAVNLVRAYGIDAEEALRSANYKFERRFKAMESEAGESFTQMSLEEQEELWQTVKRAEKQS